MWTYVHREFFDHIWAVYQCVELLCKIWNLYISHTITSHLQNRVSPSIPSKCKPITFQNFLYKMDSMIGFVVLFILTKEKGNKASVV